MIKIVVDTKEELEIVRRVLKDESCTHNNCAPGSCSECIYQYYNNKVMLYKKEIVEMPETLVV